MSLPLPVLEYPSFAGEFAFYIYNTGGGGGGLFGGGYGTDPYGDTASGVTGDTDVGYGVCGQATSGDGVFGYSMSGNGVHGWVPGSGIAIYGQGGTYAGKFDGNVQINGLASVNGQLAVNGDCNVSGAHTVGGDSSVGGNHNVTGNISVIGDVVLVNEFSGDCAEDFDVEDAKAAEPGTVMIIGAEGTLTTCRDAYDTRIAGVVSGAGELRPAVVLHRFQSKQSRAPLALIGKVFCKADASLSPISPGDLLTTSTTPGHAMKVLDRSSAVGAIVGKALRALDSGRGLIPILVSPR